MTLFFPRLQVSGAHDITDLYLDGLPTLQRCHISFYNAGPGVAQVSLTHAGRGCQQDSLQALTLRSVRGDVRLMHLSWCFITLPALRHLAVQNLGLTDLDWLDSEWTTLPPALLHSLDLDGNDALQLTAAATAALRRMPALRTLSMRKGSAEEHPGAHDGEGDGQVAWSPRSVRCIAQLVAARPDLTLCF